MSNVAERLELRTIAGAEELLAEELRGLGVTELIMDERRVAVALTKADRTMIEKVSAVRLFSTAALFLGSDDQPELNALAASADHGVVAALSPTPLSITFRIGEESPARRDKLNAMITERLGWRNEPSDWMINLTRYGNRWLAELGPLHWTRRIGRLERLGWSSTPTLAATLVRLAKINNGDRVLDPFCGTGTLLVLAGLAAPKASLVGSDVDPEAIRLATINLARFGLTAKLHIASAARIQASDDSVDRVLANLPFGKQVGSHTDNLQLYPAALAEVARILEPRGRAVLLTDDKRVFLDAAQRTPQIKIIKERLLGFGGVSPTAYVLAPTTRKRRR